MPRKSDVLRVLELMTLAELKQIASYRGIPVSGSRAELARRITGDCNRDLGAIVSVHGPWTKDVWNDFVERQFHGVRHRAFDEIKREIEKGLSGVAIGLVEQFEDDGFKVVDLRRDASLLDRYAGLLGTTSRRLSNYLAQCHGNTTLGSLGPQLLAAFPPRTGGIAPNDDAGAAASGGDGPAARTDASNGPDIESIPCGSCGATNNPAFKFCMNCGKELKPAAGARRKGASEPERDDSDAPAAQRGAAPVTRTLAAPRVGHALGGRWKVVRVLGEGGMGATFEASDLRGMRGTVVVKVALDDGSATEALENEARRALELAHENVCRYYDVDRDSKHGMFVVMQHGGESLAKRYATRPAPEADAVHLLAQAARGLDYLHGHNVVHGDVSPGNILVDKEKKVRLTDFGIATTLHTVQVTHGLTRVGELRGRNAAFASDEVNRGQPPHRVSDQASLAKVFCALLLGVDEYHRQPRYSFSRLGTRQAILDRALHADLGRRFRNCEDFVKAFFGSEPSGPA